MADRPNILIVYPDQMRADAMSCAGNPVLKTPQFDRLAVKGVRFTHAYTAFPLCCPFRASLLTGKYPHANGMYANHYPKSGSMCVDRRARRTCMTWSRILWK